MPRRKPEIDSKALAVLTDDELMREAQHGNADALKELKTRLDGQAPG